MNTFIMPSAVLGVSLAVGLFFAFRVARRPAGKKATQHDLRMRIADLELRRDELYARLRGEREENLEPREISNLENAAARTLRELDLAREELAQSVGGKAPDQGAAAAASGAPAPEAAAAPAPSAPPSFINKHPLLVGGLFGGTMVGLFALLVFWAMDDAKPGDRMAPQPGGMQQQAGGQGQMPADHPAIDDNVPAELQVQISQLESALEANPNDFASRKQLAVLLIQNQMLMPAFEHAKQILEVQPDDPDGLYISGVVRLAMGDAPTAINLLDQVVSRFPQHVLAQVYKGIAHQQLGDMEAALASWETALDAAGGRHPQLEQMIEQLKAAPHAGTGPAPADMPADHPPAGSGGAPATTSAANGTPGAYNLRVELPPGASAPPGSVLLVSLHTGSGPPAAAKRIAAPSFPAEVTLDADDGMMGTALPPSGTVEIRLDSDGDPSTEADGDLWARATVPSGRPITFVLW